MAKKTSFLLIGLLLSFCLWAEAPVKLTKSDFAPGVKATNNFLRYSSPVNALNVKLMPAFYWNSLGMEVEYPVMDMVSIGVNVIGKMGRTDGSNVVFKIRPENYQDAAYRVELAFKYYISKSAPLGFYGQFNISYGNLLYYDGTNRPYTMHSKWKPYEEGQLRDPVPLEAPKDYSFGVGAGYQLVIIPKKIIANVMVGTQLYLEQASGIYPSVYVAPSLGYVF